MDHEYESPKFEQEVHFPKSPQDGASRNSSTKYFEVDQPLSQMRISGAASTYTPSDTLRRDGNGLYGRYSTWRVQDILCMDWVHYDCDLS